MSLTDICVYHWDWGTHEAPNLSFLHGSVRTFDILNDMNPTEAFFTDFPCMVWYTCISVFIQFLTSFQEHLSLKWLPKYVVKWLHSQFNGHLISCYSIRCTVLHYHNEQTIYLLFLDKQMYVLYQFDSYEWMFNVQSTLYRLNSRACGGHEYNFRLVSRPR